MLSKEPKRILIVDGFATGSQYAARIKARGMKAYHLTSGWEKETSFSSEFIEGYLKSQVGDLYEEAFRMPDNFDEIAEKLKSYNFAAIIPGTETGVIVAEKLAARFGLPVNEPELLMARRDKYLMQQALKKAGLSYIESLFTGNLEEALNWYRACRCSKVIIKPAMSAGTDGVCSCDNEVEVKAYFDKYLNKKDAAGNLNTKLLLQEYIYGEEVVVNCVSHNSKHMFTDSIIYNKVLTGSGVPVYEASRLVFNIDEKYQSAINYTFKALDALGICYGSSHSEVKLTPKGPVLIETGARIMGSTPPIYYEALGYNLIDLSLDSYLDAQAHKENCLKEYAPKKHFMAKFFISSKDMPISEVTAEQTLPFLRSYAACNFNTLKINKHLHKTIDMPSKPGDCLLISDDEETLLQDYNICRYLEICCQNLLWKTSSAPHTAQEERILNFIKNRYYPHEEINRLLYGYKMAYKNYKNSVLYVLKDDLTPCIPGEEGEIYVAGAYLCKRPFDMPCVRKENFVLNPFYTNILHDKTYIYPFLYKTGEHAIPSPEVRGHSTNRSIGFVDRKTKQTTISFGKTEARDSWPLTYTERQMAAEQQVSPDSNAYNAKFTFKILGKLDIPRLEEALKIWVSRYRIFGSYYPMENGKFVHRIIKDLRVELNKYSCAFEDALQLIEELNKPYDITNAPLYRFTLLKTGNNQHLFHVNMHHIIADGTSLISIIEELWKLYTNKRAKKFRMEEEDFLDYSIWQNSYDNAEGKKQFFLDMFKDGVPENEMPISSVRPEILPHATEISRDVVFDLERLNEAAKRMNTSTLIMMMMAASITLAKYCGSEDIALGSIMNGRSHPQTKEMFGMFVNVVPVRFRPKGEITLGEYLKECATVFKGAIENQTCPFELLAPILAPQRNLSRKPVFDVIVNYRGEIRPFENNEIKVSSIQMYQATQIDMQFEIVRSAKNLNISISYSKELYDDEVVEDILDLIEKILNTITDNDCLNTKLTDIAELPQKHINKILCDFAGKREDWALDLTVVDRFRQTVSKNPDSRAVKFLDKTLSYKELDLITDSLAAMLIDSGIKKGDKIGLLLNRSEFMIICALGVLKTGSAYVPLDPSNPLERINYILADTAAKIVIADKNLMHILSGYKGKIITTEEIKVSEKPINIDFSQYRPSKDDAFVILYTSGTTGNPKGVLVTSGNIVGLCFNTQNNFGLSSSDNIATYAGFGFDACLSDVYPTLTIGACVHVISSDIRLDLIALDDYFTQNNITGALFTTQFGRQFATSIKIKSLRYMGVGGETLTPLVPPQGYKLYNVYGPTECTVYASYFHVDKLYERVPLGKAIINSSIYILDKNGKLAPIGTFGELCVAGSLVAKGYLNQPVLTAEKFVKNSFSDDPMFDTLYKTGDLARYLPAGIIDFLGRRDTQVKIRGFRIELNEIEVCIRKYKNIQDATVVAKEDKSGNKYVAAYVVSDETVDPLALKRFVEDELPPYMIPSFFMQLNAIPLNPNGKVDRRLLPDPAPGLLSTAEYVAPRDFTEKRLAVLWSDVLNVDVKTIGRNDNFFDLGGTSLRTTELSLRIREAFKEQMPPATIFKFPKLKEQGKYLAKNNRFPMVYSFNEKGKKTPMFFIHTANTGAEAYVPLAAKLLPDQPFYVVEPHNIFSAEPMLNGIPAIADRYIRYIRKVRPQGPYILGGWSFGAVIAYDMAVKLEQVGEKVEHLYLLDPIVEHLEDEKSLINKLMETSFFQGYLTNDPLFGRFKQLGLIDKLIGNNKNVMRDMFSYKLSSYGGKTTLFKATRIPSVPGDVDKDLAKQLRRFQKSHMDKKHNGFDKYIKHLKTENIHAIHDYFMRGNALESIANTINSKKGKPKKCK